MIARRFDFRTPAGLSLPELALLALGVWVALQISFGLGALWIGALLWAGFDAHREPAPPASMAFIAIVVTLWLVAPATPLAWDEQVWLMKAKLAALGLLRAGALTANSEVVPPGYPIGFPVACGWLGAGHVALGAIVLRAICLGAFVAAILRHRRDLTLHTVLVLACTPLVLVHLRLAYADLPVGLLSGALFVELRAETPSPLRALIVAGMLTSLKDEGLAHVVVVAGLAALQHRQRASFLATLGALCMFGAWRFLCWQHHVTDSDHALGMPVLSQLGTILEMTAHHACDVRSFGGLWLLVVALVVVALVRGPQRHELASLFVLAAVLLAAVIFGPPRVREFAMSGTLLGRLLLQLVPTAAVLVATPLAKTRGGTTDS